MTGMRRLVNIQDSSVSDHEIDLPLFAEFFQALQAGDRLSRTEEVFGHRSPVTDTVIRVGEPQPVDFRDLEIPAQVGQSPVE